VIRTLVPVILLSACANAGDGADPPDGGAAPPPARDAAPDPLTPEPDAADAAVPECDPGATTTDRCPQQGVCAGATATCAADGTWSDCALPSTHEADETRCDALDNDCDGRVDEAHPRKGQACDGDDADLCARGRWTCAADGALACAGDVEQTERCNGLDEDCDGTADEALAGAPAARQDGVCAGATRVCAGEAGWTEPDYAAIAGYEADEVSCDGLDNDCDGRVDAGLFPPDAALQDGVCAGAAQVCAGAWSEPDYAALPGYEVVETTCDGQDNDCDGATDEDVTPPPCALTEGVCAAPAAPAACLGADGFADCDYGPLYERVERDTCDGLDNDCDGRRDGSLADASLPEGADEGAACPLARQSVVVAPGAFVMGSPAAEPGRDDDETAHPVTLTRAILVRRTELTQGEWRQVFLDNPSAFLGADRPVEQVSWLDAVRFLNALSARDGLPQCYAFEGADVRFTPDCLGWRLPTEAEWEFFARAGTAGPTWPESRGLALADAAWFRDNAEGEHHPVGMLEPNPLGLYDVHGNVAEWVWDVYAPYGEGEAVDPAGPDGGGDRVSRGGMFRYLPRLLRSANRSAHGAQTRSDGIGLRPVRTLPPGIAN
jgi:formylglycine-generating enzyme required for sulfatase activity